MSSYARQLQQANALKDKKRTENRIIQLREHIKHVKGRGDRAARVKALNRKLRRLERAYALRSLIGWGSAATDPLNFICNACYRTIEGLAVEVQGQYYHRACHAKLPRLVPPSHRSGGSGGSGARLTGSSGTWVTDGVVSTTGGSS